jgi:serine/threonine-protein kinase PknG
MKCQRPGCTGTIEDGYCDTCGRAPVATGTASAKATVGKAANSPTNNSGRTNNAVASSGPSTGSAVRSNNGTTGTSGTSGTRGSGRTGSAGSRRGSKGTTRRSLGAGLIHLEPLPTLDPLQSLLTDPTVPEGKRYCPQCNTKLNLVKGFCPMCGTEYSFVPTLAAGDIVAGQYEVKGALAFGGLGWIYLGWDNALSRWVVLKGLLNSKDTAGLQAAVAERQFLAAVKHPNIVGVYNFVSEGNNGYIVMEYVGGKTLKTIRKERGPLPVAEAIAYIHRILLAFGYLHSQGLVYCDFKPDNFMVEGDDVKLIDMGGVRRIDDMDGDVYGTRGYSAPEANNDPTFASDLYTIARTLAVLVVDFPFQSSKYEFHLPTPQEEPLFAKQESLYRFLLKATREDPDQRFQTADEMAAQLLGILREIVSTDGTPRLVESVLFTGENSGLLEDPNALDGRILPVPRPDPQDPAVGVILIAASVTDPDQLASLFEQAITRYPESVEAPLLLARARIEQGHYDKAEALLKEADANDPFDWQITWLRGLSQFRQGKAKDAYTTFDRVYSEIPGELAPKLALAFAAEMSGNWTVAQRFYDTVSCTDPAFVSASFGLARCYIHAKDRQGAITAYKRVPATSRRYTQAQMALARTLVQPEIAPPGVAELTQASTTIEALKMEEQALYEISVELLQSAIRQVENNAIPAGASVTVLGHPLEAKALRFAMEQALRSCARFAKNRDEKITLIDAANRERPRTLV